MADHRHNRTTLEQREMKAMRDAWRRISGFDEAGQRRIIHWLVMKIEDAAAKRARAGTP